MKTAKQHSRKGEATIRNQKKIEKVWLEPMCINIGNYKRKIKIS
jgi:hypothetical protein